MTIDILHSNFCDTLLLIKPLQLLHLVLLLLNFAVLCGSLARVFVGKADGVDRDLDGTVWGDATYANDWLVMKWSKGWDDARFHGAPWGPDAWETNEWNGMNPDGSQSVWHYKIIWVGPQLDTSPYWRDGGYAIGGGFEVIMDQGIDPSIGPGHIWLALVTPNGFGGP